MNFKFRPSWTWQTTDIKNILKFVETAQKPIFHICSGSSCIGDIRIDRYLIKCNFRDGHKRWKSDYLGSPNILADMCNIPFKDGVAGSIICDPPYNYDFTKPELISELVRICKPRGKIVFIAPWIPNHKSITVLSTDLWRVGSNGAYHKIRTLFYKSNGQIGDYC